MNIVEYQRTSRNWDIGVHKAIRNANLGDIIILSGGVGFNTEILHITDDGERKITKKQYNDLLIERLAGI